MSETGMRALPKAFDAGADSLSKGLKWSLIGHAGIAVVILIKSLVFPGKPIAYIPALRVDIVGLPDILKKDLSKVPNTPQANNAKEISEILKKAEQDAKKIKPAPLPPKPKEIARPDEMVLKPKQAKETKEKESKKRQEKLLSSLQRMKSLAKISEESEAPKAPSVIKGNAISHGTSLSGDARESAEASYYDLIRDRLQENWELPPWLARQSLSAQIQLYIDKKGRLANFKFMRTSGNKQFDDAVKRTLQESQPYPPPPRELAAATESNGILIGFPL